MSYTLWRGDTKVGYTIGEVSHNRPGMLGADIEMLAAYTLPSGFLQWMSAEAETRATDLIIDPLEDIARREPPGPCAVHASADPPCFLVREYSGPVEHPSASTAFVLRDPDDQPLDLAMLRLLDYRSFLTLVAPAHELSIPRFRLTAIFAHVLKTAPLTL